MNKKFLQAAAITMGLSAIGLSLTACNMRPNNTAPQKTGIIDRQNNNIRNYTGYQRINNTGLNNRINRIASPLPDNRIGDISSNIARTTPLPRTDIITTPAANAYNMNDLRNKAERIEQQLESLTDVNDASVMVVGNTALVACSPKSTGVDVTKLRNTITQRVKSIDPSITNVVITESANVKQSIQQLFSNMNNKSMEQITQEFNKMVREITPSMY